MKKEKKIYILMVVVSYVVSGAIIIPVVASLVFGMIAINRMYGMTAITVSAQILTILLIIDYIRENMKLLKAKLAAQKNELGIK